MAKGKGKPPLTVTIAPLPAKAKQGANAQLDTMLRKYGPNWVKYEGPILNWAKVYHVDAVYLGALLLRENASAKPGAVSSTGALGPAQIQDTTIDPNLNPSAVWDGGPLTPQNKMNFNFAIKYSAWRLAGAVQHYGSLDGAYAGTDSALRGYNPGYTGLGPSQFVPKGHIPQYTPTPTDTAGVNVAGSVARADLTDPWVVVKNGHITTQTGAQPAGVLKYGDTPLRLSGYNSTWKQTYADTYFSYTGHKASAVEIQSILKNQPTAYTLAQQLATRPGFVNSPTWKAKAPGLVADAKTIMGQSFTAPKGFVQNALAQNWDQTTFEAKLRQSPAYLKSPEFLNNYDQNKTSFEGIFGTTDAATQSFIKDRTLDGWSPTQMQSWLRAQPAYKQSPEYQSQALSFLSSLGLITGAVPTVSQAPKVTTPEKATTNRVAGPEDITGDGLVVNGAPTGS